MIYEGEQLLMLHNVIYFWGFDNTRRLLVSCDSAPFMPRSVLAR